MNLRSYDIYNIIVIDNYKNKIKLISSNRSKKNVKYKIIDIFCFFFRKKNDKCKVNFY